MVFLAQSLTILIVSVLSLTLKLHSGQGWYVSVDVLNWLCDFSC